MYEFFVYCMLVTCIQRLKVHKNKNNKKCTNKFIGIPDTRCKTILYPANLYTRRCLKFHHNIVYNIGVLVEYIKSTKKKKDLKKCQ